QWTLSARLSFAHNSEPRKPRSKIETDSRGCRTRIIYQHSNRRCDWPCERSCRSRDFSGVSESSSFCLFTSPSKRKLQLLPSVVVNPNSEVWTRSQFQNSA